ncbi:MAG TPA: sugar transferase [Vicinamibacteria bacterium]|nr:sugar transferase [Vicinamibacteria bacterium]
MWTFPVLLDSRPSFFPPTRGMSLLLAPLGDGTVLSHLRARLRPVTAAPPVILTRFDVDPAYEEAIRGVCGDVEGVETLADFTERCYTYEPSDRLLFADPACFPLDHEEPAIRRFGEGDDPRCVKHLVAVERGGDGTKEYVDADASGRIRAIQRYYGSVTWPFATGVACSLVRVACLRVSYELPLTSLPRLRKVLAAEGVPSRDVPLERGAVHLGTETGLLAMNERLVMSIVRRSPPQDGKLSSLHADPAARVHAGARIVGPVIAQGDAEVEAGATIIGPTVLGSGSRVEAYATVVQCVVGPGQVVPGRTTLRHRVYLGHAHGSDPASQETRDAQPADSEGWETAPLSLTSERPRRSLYAPVKRAIDAVVAAAALVALSPLGLIIAALIKLESKGPIHFGHAREGMGGRPFRCWKYRTMIPDADQQQRKLAQLNQMDGPQFKVTSDPRRTRIGRILTATNLDEIPQLWNVLVGEMSLVGPRPSPFRENQICVPWREGRLSVRPGITGLWQVCRHDRHKGDFHQWIYYDLLYVRNMSFFLDLKIAVLTVLSFAKGGHIPLPWLLPPGKYGERRARVRRVEEAAEDPGHARAERAPSVTAPHQ